MSGLMGYMYDKEIENLDWDDLNFKTYGADYYEEKIPGFDKFFLKILLDSTGDDKKVIDTRPAPLKITHEESTLKFD